MKKLESRTVRELVALAREWGVSGYSKLKKGELVKLLYKKLPTSLRAGGRKEAPGPVRPQTGGSNRSPGDSARQARKLASQARLGPQDRSANDAGQSAESYVRPAIRPLGPSAAEPAPAPPAAVGADLPQRYGDGRMGLLPRDPHWLYCFWDLTAEQAARLFERGDAELRTFDVSGRRPRLVRKISLPAGAGSWYIQVDQPNRTYLCQLGRPAGGDRFEVILSSNDSTTPPAGVSERVEPVEAPRAPTQPTATAEQPPAAAAAEQAERFFGLSVGAEAPAGLDSAGALEAMRQQLAAGLAAGLASEAMHSIGLAVPPKPRGPAEIPEGDFWLRMDADLILYGATVPGSKVTLAGLPLSLDEEGHFRARFALPDGQHAFPLQGTSPDGRFSRQIHVQVQRSSQA